MRNLHDLDAYRVRDPKALAAISGGWAGDDKGGAFTVPSPIDKAVMAVIASADAGWDHVSVSRKNRCPNWTEMESIAKLFFKDDETAVQYHVPAADHINLHPYVLHWWRPHDQLLPMPPAIFV
jgi:hypothetical protein